MSFNFAALLTTVTNTSRTLPIVILYVTEECNLECLTCSYRTALPNELSLDEISALAGSLKKLGLRHIVYSGGEPLVRRDFTDICKVFRNIPVKQTLLTNGLLLKKRLPEIESYFHEIIVSLDGPDAATHDSIRGKNSFDTIIQGIQEYVRRTNRRQISIRCVLQKRNFRSLPRMVDMAKELGVDRISFLAADVLSEGFGRDTRGAASDGSQIMLDRSELEELRSIVATMPESYSREFEHHFIAESPQKLMHIVQYFEALAGISPFPRNVCNAPMVSAVITSSGMIQPCFFLPAFGNIRNRPLEELVNTGEIKSQRNSVREYTLERCHTCVCTLHVSPMNAFLDKF